MKMYTRILALLLITVFTSCEGPMGPPGYDGEDGLDAPLTTIFETTVDFTAGNNYSYLFGFPNDFEIYTSDIVMVYILWEQVDANGQVLDVWRALPQTIFVDGGVIQYNYDYTVADVKIFIDETVGELLPGDTQNQTFRIAVIPAAEYYTKSIDIESLSSVQKSLNIADSAIRKIEVK